MKEKIYIASCSFGKDSIATILLALEHNEPLDRAVFAEVMFDHSRGISGEIPEHIDWICSTAIPKLESMGVKIDVVRDKQDYVEKFHHIRTRGARKGKQDGFPMRGKCDIQKVLKLRPIHRYYKGLSDYDVVEYVGIAKDEETRLARMKDKQISLLNKYEMTEEDAKELCKAYGLLSPIYDTATRGGCWFCPSRRLCTHQSFRREHPDLWGELWNLSREDNIGGIHFQQGKTFADLNSKLDAMDAQQKLF